MTVSRGPLDADTFGARARPSCHVSYYGRVLILTLSACGLQNVMWRVEGSFIPGHCVHDPLNAGVPPFLGVMKIMHPTEEESFKEKTRSLPKPDETLFFFHAADIPPHVRTLKHFRIRGGNLGNSHPSRCVRCVAIPERR